MIVVCPACQARFQYDETRFGGSRTKRFKCPKCAHIFEVVNPALAALPTERTLSRAMEPAPEAPTVPAPLPPPPLTVPIPEPEEPLPPGLEARSTARRDREALLAAAGLMTNLRSRLRVSLAFLTGPQASTVQVIEQPTVTIGREEGDVVTRDPETSRRHAQLEIRADGTVWLTDLNSTNGTLVDGTRITGPVQLQSQQEFTCGNSTFMLLIRNTDDFPMNG